MDPRIPILLYWYLRRRYRRPRKYWVHPLLKTGLHRERRFAAFFQDLRNDESVFFNYFRMSIASFDNLLSKLEQTTLPRTNTNMRICVSTKMKLAICLRYLATGCYMRELFYSYRVGTSTISGIVRDVCSTLWNVLQEELMTTPTREQWEEIAMGFEQKANFPHCIGAVDGKHVRTKKPEHNGSLYFNYNDYFSIVLLAVVDSNYRFVYVDIGSYGKNCDSYILKNSIFWKKLIDGSLSIPEPKPLTESGDNMPFVLVADEAFALHTNLLRPFGGTHLDDRKKIFNYRLSRARRYVECAFGIMASKWRILQRAIDTSPSLTVEIVKACVVLHNFVRRHDGINYDEFQTIRTMDSLRRERNPRGGMEANNIRSKFADYFISPEGSVDWQNQYI